MPKHPHSIQHYKMFYVERAKNSKPKLLVENLLKGNIVASGMNKKSLTREQLNAKLNSKAKPKTYLLTLNYPKQKELASRNEREDTGEITRQKLYVSSKPKPHQVTIKYQSLLKQKL